MSDLKPIKKRMGRPPKSPEKGKRQNYTFRMSDADRDKLIAFAERSGRSMSEEIERRVELSFEQSVKIADIIEFIGGKEYLWFAALLIGELKTSITKAEDAIKSDKIWYEDQNKIKFIREMISKRSELTVSTFSVLKNTGVGDQTLKNMLAFLDIKE